MNKKLSLILFGGLFSSLMAQGVIIYSEIFTVASNSAPSVVGWDGYLMNTQKGTGTVIDSTGTNSGVFVNSADFMAHYYNGGARAAYFTNSTTTATINGTVGFEGDVTKLSELSFRLGNQDSNITMNFLLSVDTGSGTEWWVSQDAYSFQATSSGDFASGVSSLTASIDPLQANAWKVLTGFDLTSSGGTLGDIDNFGADRTLTGGNDILAFGVWSQKPTGNTNTRWDDFTIAVVPEPASYTLVLMGLSLLFVFVRSRRRKA